MVWALLALVVLVFAIPRLARRRRGVFAVSLLDPISTMRVELSRKHSGKKKAALDAATTVLR
jgi:hypothetical protein